MRLPVAASAAAVAAALGRKLVLAGLVYVSIFRVKMFGFGLVTPSVLASENTIGRKY